MALTLTLVTLLLAAVDWIAVAAQSRRPDTPTPLAVERAAKPLTLVALIAAALAVAADHHPRPVVLAATLVALLLSLLGDLFLVGPDHRVAGLPNFVLGLAAFLLAHIAYLVAFLALHGAGGAAIAAVFAGLLLAVAGFVLVGVRVRRGAVAEDPALGPPVLAYLLVISLMQVAAWWTLDLRIVLGAVLFVVSDSVLGWTRFVAPDRRGPLAVMVTYHLAQVFLVLGLLRR